MQELTTPELKGEQIELYNKCGFQTKCLCTFWLNCLIFVEWMTEITCLFDATSVDRVCLKPLLPDSLERPYRTCIALRNEIHWVMEDRCLYHSYPAFPLCFVLYSNFIPFFFNNAVGRNVNPVYCWQERNGRKTHSCPKNGRFKVYFVSGIKEAVMDVECQNYYNRLLVHWSSIYK